MRSRRASDPFVLGSCDMRAIVLCSWPFVREASSRISLRADSAPLTLVCGVWVLSCSSVNST